MNLQFTVLHTYIYYAHNHTHICIHLRVIIFQISLGNIMYSKKGTNIYIAAKIRVTYFHRHSDVSLLTYFFFVFKIMNLNLFGIMSVFNNVIEYANPLKNLHTIYVQFLGFLDTLQQNHRCHIQNLYYCLKLYLIIIFCFNIV